VRVEIKTQGLVLDRPQTQPQLEEVIVADPGPDEVRVRLIASGVCHTDISAVRDARLWPVLLGHEGAGIVESTGANVSHVGPGDHVIISWRVACGHCIRCQRGRQDLCENVQATAARRVRRTNGKPLHVMLNAGTFCQYAVVPAFGAIPIRQDMPLQTAALIGCAVSTGVGAALYTARDAMLTFQPRAFMSKQQTIQGCIYGSCRPPIDFPLFVNWYLSGRMKMDELLSAVITPDALPQIFESDASPQSIRTIVAFGE